MAALLLYFDLKLLFLFGAPIVLTKDHRTAQNGMTNMGMDQYADCPHYYSSTIH